MNQPFRHFLGYLTLLLFAVMLFFISCNYTKHLKQNEAWLYQNKIDLRTHERLKNKSEIEDNLGKLLMQRPNTSTLPHFYNKILWYNLRHKKFQNKPDSLLPKKMERPIVFDSSVMAKSDQNMRNYLFNIGYFNVHIKDTFHVSKRKAFAKHIITLGDNVTIDKTGYEIPDTDIGKIVDEVKGNSKINTGAPYSISLMDEERTRLTAAIRNKGYYHFTQDNLIFRLDTLDKVLPIFNDNPFESAFNNLPEKKEKKKLTADVDIIVRQTEDSLAFTKFTIGEVIVFPDFIHYSDISDTTMYKKSIDSIKYFYHEYYVHSKILSERIFIKPGKPFSQQDYDKTIVKLNELGIFQYIKVLLEETHDGSNIINCTIIMNRTKKFDLSTNPEISSGSTYSLGASVGLNFHNKNFEKGANLFTLSLNGGIEYAYQEKNGNTFVQHFQLLTEYSGINASIDFPKFLAPFNINKSELNNVPHSIVNLGSNVITRVNYFTLINTSSSFVYSWHKSKTTTITLSPAFINIIRMPEETDSFKRRLDSIPFLKNSYKSNFIEGENISFTYNNMEKKHGKNYTYLKIGLEEAGGALNGLNQIGVALNDLFKIQYGQYAKLDFDLRHYFSIYHSTLAFRFSGGVGFPLGYSKTLPYIKQYFVGGPYGLRGWQVRTLGPGSYYDATLSSKSFIDRTGDMRLEWNGEFRFPIAPLFAGAIKMNGALFADAGNIWLAQKDNSYPGGEFEFSSLGRDIAMDMGLGARFDIASFLNFRIDVAMPVKKPYEPNNDGWVFNQIALNSSKWVNNNIVLNLTIGYPF